MSATLTSIPIFDERKRRCTVCKARPGECLCSSLRRVPVPLMLFLVQHTKERFSQSNTGNLVWRVLEGTRVVPLGGLDVPVAAGELLRPDLSPLVLFPLPESPVIGPADAVADQGRVPALIVLDGTWGQARRMSRRIPGLRRLRFRRLPDAAAARWRLRQPQRAGQLGTAEAVAWALEAMGFATEAEVLWEALDLIARRVLRIRGRRAPAPVEREP